MKASLGEIPSWVKKIRGYHHDDDTRKAILSANGLPDDGTIKDAVNLNNLDDWKEFHASVIAG